MQILLAVYPDRFVRNEDPCVAFDYNCSTGPATTALAVTLFASWFIWIIMWIWNIGTALEALHQRPWHEWVPEP